MVGRLANIASDDEAKCLDRNRLLVLPVDDRGQQVLVHMSRDNESQLLTHRAACLDVAQKRETLLANDLDRWAQCGGYG